MKKLNGVQFDFGGGRIYTMAPLSIKDMLQLRKPLQALQMSEPFDPLNSFDACIAVVYASLVRNHPDLTKDDVSDLLDMGNVLDAITCVVNPKGFLKSLTQNSRIAGNPQGDSHGK